MTKLEEAGTKGLIRAGLGPKLVILFYFHFLNMAIFLGVVGAAVLGILEVYLCYGISIVMETFDGDFFFPCTQLGVGLFRICWLAILEHAFRKEGSGATGKR